MFEGAFTALVTPFKNGRIDEDAYRALIDWQIREGIHGIVPCGTTGESATLSHEEHKRVMEIAVDEAAGRVPVIVGTGSNSTREAVRLTGHAREIGADAALVITPYYNKPTPEGIYQHYKLISDETHFPLIVYNVPSRTGTNLSPDMAARLAGIGDIIGIKEATGDLKQVSEIIEGCGVNFTVLSGDDFTVLPLLAVGGRGVISVVSNIVPSQMVKMVECMRTGDLAGARAVHMEILPLARAMFIETNPIPVKTSLALMGKMTAEFRLPLCEMLPENRKKLTDVLKQFDLLGETNA